MSKKFWQKRPGSVYVRESVMPHILSVKTRLTKKTKKNIFSADNSKNKKWKHDYPLLRSENTKIITLSY